jgi:hypothetical protein
MAQTSGAISGTISRIEISTDLTVWRDISGTITSVQNTEQSRNSGEAYTMDGDTAIITNGKRTPMELTFNLVYSESATESFEVSRAAFESASTGQPIYIRWVPAGTTTGTVSLFRTPITGSPARLTAVMYPSVDASAGGPVMGSFKVKTPLVEKTSASNTSGGSGT